jgi:hypothetical protein
MLSDHAAQNLRTSSIGLSIWLLLWSSFSEGGVCGFSAGTAHTGHLQKSGSGRVQVRRRQGDQASPPRFQLGVGVGLLFHTQVSALIRKAGERT